MLRRKPIHQLGGILGGNVVNVPFSPDIQPINAGTYGQVYTDAPLLQFPGVDKSKIVPDLNDLFKDLKGKGHTNDVNQLMQQKAQLDSQLSSMTDLEMLSGSSKFKTLMAQYQNLNNPARINELIRSKDLTDSAWDTAKAKKIQGEIIVQNELVSMVNDKGEYVEVPIDRVTQAYNGGYKPLTRTQLMIERDKNPLFTNQNNVVEKIAYGKSSDEITDDIYKQLSQLGSTERGSKTMQSSIQAIQELGASVFEIETGSGSTSKNNINQILAAIDAIKLGMSQESRDGLKARAIQYLIENGSPINRETINNQMNMFIASAAKSKQIDSITTESKFSIGKDLSGSIGGANKYTDIGFFETNVGLGLAPTETRQVTTSVAKINIAGTEIPMPITENNKPYYIEKEKQIAYNFSQSTLAPISMGNNIKSASGVSYKGNEIYPVPGINPMRTYAVIDREGNPITSPEAMKKAQKAQEEIEKLKRSGVTGAELQSKLDKLEEQFKSEYNIQPVISFKAVIPKDKEVKNNAKEGIHFVPIKVSDTPYVNAHQQNVKSSYTKGIFPDFLFNEAFVETDMYVPITPKINLRNLDKNPVYINKNAATLDSQLQSSESTKTFSGQSLTPTGDNNTRAKAASFNILN
jgi:hypothetical protein